MPYKNLEDLRRAQRNWLRTKRHGDWRRAIARHMFQCANCGEPLIDDLHEPFGEVKNNSGSGDGKMQLRMPLCFECHTTEHLNLGGCIIEPRKYPSTYMADIYWEIEKVGGLDAWYKKYNIDPSEFIAPKVLDTAN